jgi:capsular exopolysaccharide synthesis family protein
MLSPAQSVATQVEVLQSAPLLGKVMGSTGAANLTVTDVKDTNIIEVTAEAHSPSVAAAVPNKLLEAYISQDINQNIQEIRAAKQFAQDQETEMHSRMLKAQAQIRDFKQKNKVDDLDADHQALSARVIDLNKQLLENENQLASSRAELASSQAELAKAPTFNISARPGVNPARADLRSEIAKLQVDRVSMTQRGGFTNNAPQVIAIDARIAELKRQLALEPALISSQVATPNGSKEGLSIKVTDLKTTIAATSARVAALRQQLSEAQSGIAKFAGWDAQYAGLYRELTTSQDKDKMFADKIADLNLREQAHHQTAHIIQRAQVPSVPVRPKKVLNLLLSCFAGLFLGICLALLQDFLDDRINSVEEANRLLRLPALGNVPVWGAGHGRLLPQMSSLDPAAESYRLLRTNIHFASVDSPARSLLVTSANPGEGKSTTAANLACAMALDGKKIILVDTDLRRPSIHKMFELLSVPGLTDVILGHSTLDDTLQSYDLLPNLSILPAGSIPPNPSEVLNSRTFTSVLADLTNRCDVVIFDSPPVLVAADAAILASQMDGCVLVVETGSTKKGAAVRALQIMQQARSNVLGVSYNKMSAQSGSYYYYYNYSYHSLDRERPDSLISEDVDAPNANKIDGENGKVERSLGSPVQGKDDK